MAEPDDMSLYSAESDGVPLYSAESDDVSLYRPEAEDIPLYKREDWPLNEEELCTPCRELNIADAYSQLGAPLHTDVSEL